MTKNQRTQMQASEYEPLRTNQLKEELIKLGLENGMKILVHVSLSKIGNVEAGPETLISAMKEVITDDGIIVMPAYNSYGDYKPNLSIVNEFFKNQADIIRTNQIIAAFAVWGKEKEKIAANIEYTEKGLSFEAGEKSTLARLYDNNGWSLMLGTDYSTCTIMHLAENRAEWPSKIIFTEEYLLPDGKRVQFHDVAYQDEDFNMIGDAFESIYKNDISALKTGRIGKADCKLINQRIFVDFAVNWMKKNRN